METTQARHTWYATDGSGGQGLVIDEDTGRNVAVAYDSADAPLLAAAPELLRELEACAEYIAQTWSDDPSNAPWCLHTARAAIAKTTE